MKKKIFQNFKLEINYFKHMNYSFDTIYFLKKTNKFNSMQLSFLNKINKNIICLDYKDLILKDNEPNIILENKIFEENQSLFLIDFNDTPNDKLLSFLNSYYENKKNQKSPIIILNKSKKDITDELLIKNTKFLDLSNYLLLKYGTSKKIILKKSLGAQPKNNKWYILGFSALNLLSFIFMAIFGSTTQYVQMSALLESMTYFMNNQPENSRIHAVYHEHFETYEERTAMNVRNKYSNLQNETTSYQFGGIFNSYFVAGTPENLIKFDVKFKDYDDDSLRFKTKIISQHVYSNQKRVLMENINLEQYLIKEYAHHSPLHGAESVYYMPSNLADEIILNSNNNDFRTYSDFIGKLIVVKYEENDIKFEQTMSINNIFYTSNVPKNIGVPNDNEKVNIYSNADRNFGKYLLNTIGDFGVSMTVKAHGMFGSVFCFDFLGYNKILKMMLDSYFADDLKNATNYFEFSYLNEPISAFGFQLDKINEFYRENRGIFHKDNILYFLISLFSVIGGFILFFYYLRERKSKFSQLNSSKFISFNILMIIAPFIFFQSFLLILIAFTKHVADSVGLMNVLGSPFSLVITTILISYLFIFLNKDKKNVFKIEV